MYEVSHYLAISYRVSRIYESLLNVKFLLNVFQIDRRR